jgi:hypothetical protein
VEELAGALGGALRGPGSDWVAISGSRSLEAVVASWAAAPGVASGSVVGAFRSLFWRATATAS